MSQDIPNIDLRMLRLEELEVLLRSVDSSSAENPRCIDKGTAACFAFSCRRAVFHPGPRCNGFLTLMPYASAFRNGTWRFAGHYLTI